jgi:delta8-fatty-acid desaturase
MMKKYRIGRVQEPWTNLEPPIRAAKPHSDSDLDEKKCAKATDRRSRRSVDLSSVSLPFNTCLANIAADVRY